MKKRSHRLTLELKGHQIDCLILLNLQLRWVGFRKFNGLLKVTYYMEGPRFTYHTCWSCRGDNFWSGAYGHNHLILITLHMFQLHIHYFIWDTYYIHFRDKDIKS